MFKRISCVAFGAVFASLISAVEPAQAFSIRSSSSSFYSSPTLNSLSSFNTPSTGYGQSSFGSNSPSLLSQGTQVGSTGSNWLYGIPLALLIWMIAEGLDTTGDDGEPTVVLGKSIVKLPTDTPGIPGTPGTPGTPGIPDGGTPPTAVPSPALLPGLVGMGVAAIRKRKQLQSNQA
ncbi:PTPA-CTERM sorting domain-containing protein [Leptothoe spongobia]|uniref:PTPA-CTERM sorting domain-containing protein n=1 Tax=Leptothoe spongobia TAU-MAC 1115 TaxID=1967444 RepID=A0A947DD13_9CYAN|nr:PTPA-CTERM sorting domain-containing protein [Leptothoe spongobia]MBT9314723.1 PTPA-CTERM sorting domain-containing protein [Leptothoe spongobia TAU-MAC 1115]